MIMMFHGKKHENMFNFMIMSNGFAAHCIHLGRDFVPGRASQLFIKWMFLGQHVGPDCQLISISKVPFNSEDLSALYQRIVWPFFWFSSASKWKTHKVVQCSWIQNLWDDSSDRFIVLVRSWRPEGRVFEFV